MECFGGYRTEQGGAETSAAPRGQHDQIDLPEAGEFSDAGTGVALFYDDLHGYSGKLRVGEIAKPFVEAFFQVFVGIVEEDGRFGRSVRQGRHFDEMQQGER